MTALPHVELFTDGACSGNPGPGGWAFVLRHPATKKQIERSGAEHDTTNNRMELMAVIEGLRALTRPSAVDLTSDSQYVLNGLKEWMEQWKKRGWRTAGKKPVKNQDLWETLDLLRSRHEIRFHWIRGHQGHAENERCDELAVAAYRSLPPQGRAGEGWQQIISKPNARELVGRDEFMSGESPRAAREYAKQLRKNLSGPEAALWSCLRNNALGGFKFRRQHPLGPYIVDFYCHTVRLAVEVDGPHHELRVEHDARRDAWMASRGVRTMRISASDVESRLEEVVEAILQEVERPVMKRRPPHPGPHPRGRE